MASIAQKSLADQISTAPRIFDPARAQREMSALQDVAAGRPDLEPLRRALERPAVAAVIAAAFSASPYLTRLMRRYPDILQGCLDAPPEISHARADDLLYKALVASAPRAEVMRTLRRYKSTIAMLTALADTGGVWPVMTVTRVLSMAADATVVATIAYLFANAQTRGDWLDVEADAEFRSGYFVLAMGKHGAFELNYSSDIDLIVFYDSQKAHVRDRSEMQSFFVKLTRELVRFLQEATEDGYAFRVDLRLRPDPGSTPVALSTRAAFHYYESVGQNWERAALIKARVIAGDAEVGNRFLADLAPFIWRKYLDFAAIADVHAMKRQIHATKGFGSIAVEGHNIKLGRGGIREIEFFAQTQQLIAGGRQQDLRVADTLTALARLCDRGWIAADVRDELTDAYKFLRLIEHRLQMVDDEQTQTLPSDVVALASLACFSGFAGLSDFSVALTRCLETVLRHYSKLFEGSPDLTAHGRNLVLAGATDDPATLNALSAMGYSSPATVIEVVRGWHHGRIRAVRSPRARELLTEMQPLVIEALAATANPDQSFTSFDRFLSDLPSGVQLFALLKSHPALLDLLANIIGTAPRLARVLSMRSRILDAVLDPGFFGQLPTAHALREIAERELSPAIGYEQVLDRARVVGSEQSFLIGVRVLTGTVNASDAGKAYAALADALIAALAAHVEAEMIRSHGKVDGGAVAVVAMGKLGGNEMTAASDLDLIVIYDFNADTQHSMGRRPLTPSQFYTRYTQRLIGALSAPTSEGALFDIDLRLRPSGQKGPVATQLSSFVDYQANEAWTWEHMALTRARVVSGPADLRRHIETSIADVLRRPRDRKKIAEDVRDMRKRIADAKGTSDPWDLKQVRGGLVDIEFIAQYLQLVHAASHPHVLSQTTSRALANLAAEGLLPRQFAQPLLSAANLYNNLTQILRLCLNERFDPATAPEGLKRLLASVGEAPTFSALTSGLLETQDVVSEMFDRLIV